MTLERLEERSLLAAAPVIASFVMTPATNTGAALTQSPPIGDITSNVHATFDVTAPETSLINIYNDPGDTGVVDPANLVGSGAIAGSDPTTNATQTISLNTTLDDSVFGTSGGTRYLIAQATDSTGTDVGPALEYISANSGVQGFFLDTTNPVIASVSYTANSQPVYSSTPAASQPPSITGITIEFQDATIRDSVQFAGTPGSNAPGTQALNYVEANVVSNYSVIGTHSGPITISSVNVLNQTTLDGPGVTDVQLTFASALPNDTYNLIVSHNLVNDANNQLFGSTAAAPSGSDQTLIFPTGTNPDGTPETEPADFNPGALSPPVLFAAITEPGVGVANAGTVQISSLQNISGASPPSATFARPSDVVFAGNFPDFADAANPPGANANGFSKLAAYGKDPTTGQYRWLFENSDGTVTQAFNPDNINGLPVAGNFFSGSNDDGLGIFTGNTWYLYSLNLDANGNPSVARVQTVPWSVQGLPVVGNFIVGDTFSDLATYNVNTGAFTVASSANYSATATVPLLHAPGVRARPVAASIEGNGLSDLGLWVPDIGGQPSAQKLGDWYFLETGGASLLDNPPITVVHTQFGSSIGVPFTGLFAAGSAANPTVPPGAFGATSLTAAKSVTAAPMLAATRAVAAAAKPVAKPAVPTIASTIQSLSGTTGNDVFQLSPGKLPGYWNLSVNGVLRDSNVELTSLKLNGLGGKNSLVITGTGKGEDAEVWSDHAIFRSGGLSLTATNFTSISIVGAGTDTATLHDAAGANTLVANGGVVTLSGSGYTETVRGFASTVAVAAAGSSDVADLYASTASPVVKNVGGTVTLTDAGKKVATVFFNTDRIHAKNGAVTNTFTYSKSAKVVAAAPKKLSAVNLAAAVPLVKPKSSAATTKAAAAVTLLATSSSTDQQKQSAAVAAVLTTTTVKWIS